MKTKVRLLSFLLTIVMLVGLMPMTTLAASEITGVELTITEPTIGANLDFTADVDGASPYTVTGVDWTTRWDAYYVRHNESTIVETGQPYTVYIYLEPKEGYSFAADTDDIAVTINGSSVGITKDLERTRLTCMLTYEELGYTISFDANGGTGTMADTKVYDDYTLPTCSFGAPEGKAFIGWAINSAEGTWYYPGTKLEVNTDMRLYAKWVEETGDSHTLTFVNEAFDPPQTETILVNYGRYTLPECLFETATGCRFGGWYVDTNGDGIYEEPNAGEEIFVTGDMEIYVKWDPIEYRTVRNAEFKATVTGEYKHGMLAGSVSVALENDAELPICMVSGGYGHGYWISSDEMLLGSDALSTLGVYDLYVRFKKDDDCSDALICDSNTFKVTGDFGNITPWRNVTVLPDGTYILEFDLPAVPGTELSTENITFTLDGYEAGETITAITAGVDTPHVSLRGSGYGSGLDAKSYMIWEDYYDYGYGIYDGPSKFENSRTYYLEINYALDEGYSFPASFWDGEELIKEKFKLSGFETAEVYEVGQNSIVFKLPQMGNTVIENVEFILNGYEEGEAAGNVTVTILDEMIFPRDDLDYFFYDESVGFSPEGAMSPIPATVFENGERYYIAMLIEAADGYDASELEMEDFTIHTPYGSCTATGYGRATAFTYNEYYYVGFELPVINNAAYTTYTISFDADGGTGTMSDVTGVFGEYTLPANGFTAPSDKQFKAWSVEGVEKAVDEKITVIANTTVTAVWEDISIPKTPVDTVNISDLAKPVVGEMPDNSITVSGTGVTVDDEGSYWGRFDSSRFSPVYDDDTAVDSVVFRDGETYMFQLYLYAEDGYEFTAESKFYFAGELLPAPDMDDLSKSFAMVNPGDSTIAVVYINMNDIAHVHVSGDWDYNDTYHWHKCTASGCDAGTDVSGLPDYAEHSFVGGICTCGAHQHNWSAEWSVNETHHWHECSATGCTATDNSDKDGYAAHDFTTGVCVCGVENVIASIEISGITAPVTGETPINSASVDKVGAEVDEENTFWVRYDTSTGRTSDTYDDGSFVYNTPFREGEIYLLQIMIKPKTGYGFMADTKILYGGTELSAPDAANPTTSCGAIAPDYSMAMALINPNGASAPLTYTVSFEAGEGTGTMTTETGISGEYTLPACDFTAPDGKQFKAWSVGSVEKAVGEKITVTANTTVTAVWEDIPHTHVYDKEVATDTYKATEASCTAKATYYKSCACGAKGTETFAYGELAAHTPDHEGGATEEYAIKCSVCNYEMEPQLSHTHVFDKEVANDTYKATEASCTAKATYYKSCACGAKGTETFAYGELAAHTEGTAWSSDEDNHWHVCTATGCGAVIEESEAPHSFEWIIDRDATETQAGAKHEECSVCDYKKETVEIPATGTGTQPESTPTPAPTAPATPLPTAVPVVQSPKTGDSMSWIWLAVFMVSGLGVVTTIVLGKKSQPDKE